MSETEKLYTGVSRAAWGCIFLYFNINLNSINILLNFVGYLLFLSSISLLEEQVKDFGLLRPLGILLAGWSGAEWGLTIVGITLGDVAPVLSLIVAAIDLYFIFQLFTDFALLAKVHQAKGEHYDQQLIKWRTVQVLLNTILHLPILRWTMGTDWEMWITVPLLVVGVITGIRLMTLLFSMRKLFVAEQTE